MSTLEYFYKSNSGNLFKIYKHVLIAEIVVFFRILILHHKNYNIQKYYTLK